MAKCIDIEGNKITFNNALELKEYIKNNPKVVIELNKYLEFKEKGEVVPGTIEEISPDYGVRKAETNLTEQETEEFINLLKPQAETQTFKENKGKNANMMFHYGLRWGRKKGNPATGVKPMKAPINNNPADGGSYYGYDKFDQNGNPLPPLSDLQPIIDKMEQTLGEDMSDYDSVIANIYLPGEYIYPHRDTTESKTAEKYGVKVMVLGNDAALGIWDNNKGKMTFANTYDSRYAPDDLKNTNPTNEIVTTNGTIYEFGNQGKGRFNLVHTTPDVTEKPLEFPPIKLPNGKVVTNYTVTLTFRRAQTVDGKTVPKAPKKVNTQIPTSSNPITKDEIVKLFNEADFDIDQYEEIIDDIINNELHRNDAISIIEEIEVNNLKSKINDFNYKRDGALDFIKKDLKLIKEAIDKGKLLQSKLTSLINSGRPISNITNPQLTIDQTSTSPIVIDGEPVVITQSPTIVNTGYYKNIFEQVRDFYSEDVEKASEEFWAESGDLSIKEDGDAPTEEISFEEQDAIDRRKLQEDIAEDAIRQEFLKKKLELIEYLKENNLLNNEGEIDEFEAALDGLQDFDRRIVDFLYTKQPTQQTPTITKLYPELDNFSLDSEKTINGQIVKYKNLNSSELRSLLTSEKHINLYDSLNLDGLIIELLERKEPSAKGSYNSKTNTLTLYRDGLQKSGGLDDINNVIIHELLHYVTLESIKNNKELKSNLITFSKSILNNLTEKDVKVSVNKDGYSYLLYALTGQRVKSLSEINQENIKPNEIPTVFFTDGKVYNWAKNKPYQSDKSIIDKLLDLFKSIIGIDIPKTLLDEITLQIAPLIDKSKLINGVIEIQSLFNQPTITPNNDGVLKVDGEDIIFYNANTPYTPKDITNILTLKRDNKLTSEMKEFIRNLQQAKEISVPAEYVSQVKELLGIKLFNPTTLQELENNAVAVIKSKKGDDKYIYLKGTIDENQLNSDNKNGTRIKNKNYKGIEIVSDYYSHKTIKDVTGNDEADILIVDSLEDAQKQYDNYIKGGAKQFTSIEFKKEDKQVKELVGVQTEQVTKTTQVNPTQWIDNNKQQILNAKEIVVNSDELADKVNNIIKTNQPAVVTQGLTTVEEYNAAPVISTLESIKKQFDSNEKEFQVGMLVKTKTGNTIYEITSTSGKTSKAKVKFVINKQKDGTLAFPTNSTKEVIIQNKMYSIVKQPSQQYILPAENNEANRDFIKNLENKMEDTIKSQVGNLSDVEFLELYDNLYTIISLEKLDFKNIDGTNDFINSAVVGVINRFVKSKCK